jgi:hypothetical protein
MDTPTQHMLKVGKVTIDLALNTARSQQLSQKEAVEYIYQDMSLLIY